MDRSIPVGFDPKRVQTPCFVVDESLIGRNLDMLASVRARTGCSILLALKGFAMFSMFPVISKVLQGTCSSSPHEARLGREEFGGEVHAYAAAFSEADVRELLTLVDHLVFNSFGQWKRFRPLVKSAAEASGRKISCGIRVNPEKSVGHTEIYDPCAKGSRLGVRIDDFEPESLEGIEGLHFHALCEQNSTDLEMVIDSFEEKFGKYLKGMKWVNFGGGHHITRPDYDVDRLCGLVDRIRSRYGVHVYLEPGEAVALDTGVLVATVLDVINGSDMKIAILDTSAACHMPDVLEMPYRPRIVGGGEPDEKKYTYRLGGLSCLAGDIIGEYSFDEPLEVGTRLMFLDMGHYSMVKTNTFNGIKLPSIAIYRPERDEVETVKTFGYQDFRSRLS